MVPAGTRLFDFISKRYAVNVLSARWTYLLESSGFLKIYKKISKIEDFKVDSSKFLGSEKISSQYGHCHPTKKIVTCRNASSRIVSRIHPANHIMKPRFKDLLVRNTLQFRDTIIFEKSFLLCAVTYLWERDILLRLS